MKMRPIVHLASRLLDGADGFILQGLREAGYSDVAPSHGDVLVVLFEHNGCTVTEIAQRTHRTKSTISVLVDRLEGNGYLEKRRSQSDARALGIFLTAKGEALKPVVEDISRRLNRRIEDALGREKADLLAELLGNIQGIF